MKKLLLGALLLLSMLSYSQITPTIPVNGTIVTNTVISGNYTYNGNLKVQSPATLTVNYGVNFTLNGNWNTSNGSTIFSGNNLIVVTGNVNSSVKLSLQGNVCFFAQGNMNPSSGNITSTGDSNYISCSGNLNNSSNIPSSICATGNLSSNPCSNPSNLNCTNQCSSSSNNLATWNGSTWLTNGNPTSVPTNTKVAVINGNYSATSFSVCKLTINSGKTLTVNSGIVITVVNQIVNNGTIIIEDGGSIVQQNNGSTNTGNNNVVKRTTTPLKMYDYTYWSTPVNQSNLQSAANGTDCYSYTWNPNSNNWDWANLSDSMVNGKGYIVRASEEVTYPSNYTSSFYGKINNGTITLPITKAIGEETQSFNLVGNPYPCSLDAKEFITTNSGIINGTLYFWTHKTAIALASTISNPGTGVYAYSRDDYAKYNLTGGVGTGTAATNGPNAINNPIPNGNIGTGQAFFIQKSLVGTSNITFNNSMRKGNSNTQFFRVNDDINTNENRIWLDLTNSEGIFSQTLIGYVDGATDDYDSLYDGKTIDGGNYVNFYSMLGTEPMVIQGVENSFEQTDMIPLGYVSSLQTNFTISIEQVDGLFEQQDIYLLDNLLGITTNLKLQNYSFQSEIGQFNDRFEIRFTNGNLNVIETNKNPIIVILKKDNVLMVKSTQEIQSITIHDMLGRVLYTSNISSYDFEIPFNTNKQVILISTKTKSAVTTKKIIN